MFSRGSMEPGLAGVVIVVTLLVVIVVIVWMVVVGSQGSLSAHVFAAHVRTAMEGFRALLEGPRDVECV